MAMVEKKNAKSNYFKEVGKELKKVNYPTVAQVRKNTIVVIVLSIIVGIFIAILDFGFGRGASYILNHATVAPTATAGPQATLDPSMFQRDENGNITGYYDENGNLVPIAADNGTGGAASDTAPEGGQ